MLSLRVVRFFQWMFIVLLLGTVIALFGLNFPTFHRNQAVVVSSAQGREVYGSLYQGSRDMGVFIVGDLDEDQMALKSIAQEFYGSGAHVMVLDYSGHGISRSDVDLEWLESDGLTDEIRKGMEMFRRKAGLEDQQILVVGHGFGARGLLHLITTDKNSFMGASLIAPDIALLDEKQESPYLGKRDDRSVGWINNLNSYSVDIPIQLVATEGDERVSAASVTALYQKLTGTSFTPYADPKTGLSSAVSGTTYLTIVNEQLAPSEKAETETEDAGIEQKMVQLAAAMMQKIEEFDRGIGQNHLYQLQSNTVSTVVKDWSRSKAEMRSISSTTIFPMLRLICWCVALLSLICVSALSMLLAWKRYPAPEEDPCGIALYTRNALPIRLAMWLPAILIGLLLWLILSLLPIGDLTGVLLPISMMGGYGLLVILLYMFHRMPGSKGDLLLIGGGLSFWRSMTSVIMMVGLGCYIAFVHYSGLAFGWMAGHQFGWSVVITIVLAIGFYGAELECDILTDNGANFAMCMLYRLIFLLPAILCCLLFQDVMPWRTVSALLIAFFLSGAFRRHSGGRLISSVGAAFLFCMLVIPFAVIAA